MVHTFSIRFGPDLNLSLENAALKKNNARVTVSIKFYLKLQKKINYHFLDLNF